MERQNAIFAKDTIEFVAVVLEFCALVEEVSKYSLFSFTDKAVKILPLLYLKATLLPVIDEPEDDGEPEQFITENTYNTIRYHIANLMGENDSY
jgi:hypothetical protein